MNTPIFDFVTKYIKQNQARMHMPGHKGVSLLGCEERDITEIKGADELYTPKGIILESQRNATSLFGTKTTLYSVGGSSQSINAMLFLALLDAKKGDNRPFVLAARNVHKSFVYSAAKLDVDVKWMYGQSKDFLTCVITPMELENTLKELKNKPFAVYVTSPDYLGKMCDIKGLSKVCKSHNIPLLVDNAHGAYLAFLKDNIHPINLGADMCCDSAHKTLPVLTGGGYLHIAKSDLYGFSKNALKSMEMFGSTSPSYLILQSLDLCNKYIAQSIKKDLEATLPFINNVALAFEEKGIKNLSEEPLKITADFSKYMFEDLSPAEYFRKKGIECEYSDKTHVVFMLTTKNQKQDFERLINSIKGLKLLKREVESYSFKAESEQKLTIRQAVFGNCEEIEAEKSLGRICGAPTVSCPPAVPIAVSGEVISEEHIKLFKNYGIKKIMVVKN